MTKLSGANPIRSKRQNGRYIREIIYRYGPISRSQIAEMLSLTPATITMSVSEMLAQGVVYELAATDNGREEGHLGRKPVDISFITEAAAFLGVEITPDTIYTCLTDLSGTVLASSVTANTDYTYERVLELTADRIKAILAEHGDTPPLMGIGVGIPGFIEGGKGEVRSQRRFHWKNKPLAEDLSRLTGYPVHIDNNVRARVIREGLSRRVPNPETLAYFFVSKGIACQMMLHNTLVSGQTTGAGEVGHMIVELDGPKCQSCGNYGCLEAFASETTLRARCAQAIAEGGTILAETAADFSRPTLDEIFAAAASGDEAVNGILRTAFRYLAIALANIINFMSPQLVIVDARILHTKRDRSYFLEQVKLNLYDLNSVEAKIEFKEYDQFGGAKASAAMAVKEFFLNADS